MTVLRLVMVLSFLLATSCSNNNEVPQATIKKEDSSIPIPKTSVTIKKDGNTRTLAIVGQINEFYFDQLYHQEDGSQPGSKESIRTAYRLNFDKALIFSNGKQPFTFTRTAPYNYILKHTVLPEQFETNRITIISNGGIFEKEY